MSRFDWTGAQLGVWSIQQYLGYEAGKGYLYLARDLFGNEKILNAKNFKAVNFGRHFSIRESIKLNSVIINNYKHMLRRCYDSKCVGYKTYGALGIKVSPEWLGAEGFINFRIWLLQNNWTRQLTVDRIDNTRGYSVKNCRLVTKSENSRHRTTTKLTTDIVDTIRTEFLKLEPIRGYKKTFIKSKARFYNVADTTIQAVLDSYTWN